MAIPNGINSERFIQALEISAVQQHMREWRQIFKDMKVIVAVDRSDMIEGIPKRLLAFEEFLEKNPTWCGKVTLVHILVPTTTNVPEYEKLLRKVHEIVGRNNGRFVLACLPAILHMDRSFDFHCLCALYAVADIALVTSLSDVMNLMSYEFVACQEAKKGVLILSKSTVAAQSLGAGAILVNPWNITEVAASIRQALNMSSEERELRHRHNFQHVKTHTVQQSVENFLSKMNDNELEAQVHISKVPPELPQRDAIGRYYGSRNRILILEFNAISTEPMDNQGGRGDPIKEMDLELRPELKERLKTLCSDPNTTVVVVGGCCRNVLDKNFKDYNMWLAAENGMFLRPTNGEWMTTMPEHLTMEWFGPVKLLFKHFTERTPKSHFEERETSLVWNYKNADVEFGRLHARELLQHLWAAPISNTSADVVQGSHSIEVRAIGVTKGATIDRILGEIVHSKSRTKRINFVLCIGNFLKKDEDVYSVFEPEFPSLLSCAKHMRHLSKKKISQDMLDLNGGCNYFSCSVGRTPTKAKYHLTSSEDVVSFLHRLADATVINTP